jgi:subtilase family serine protease
VSLPVSKTGEITFYLSLPASTARLSQAAAKVATPGSSTYRRFSSLATASRQFGATDTQINAIAGSVQGLGLQFAADPTRLFARMTGSAKQWQAALGTPLTEQPATASNPFISYSLPAKIPAALQPSGTSLLLQNTQVYDAAAEGRQPSTETVR